MKINKNPATPLQIITRSDFITHKLIRNENPITDINLEIVFENDEFIVVNKPSSWPVHVCGGYQFNTLHRILMDQYNYENLKVLHRLDKPTSGIVILAKSKEMAEYFRQKLHSDSVQKTYLCRVKGEVLWEKKNVVRAILLIDKAKGIYSDSEGGVRFGESLKKGEHYADDVDLNEKEDLKLKEEYEDEKNKSLPGGNDNNKKNERKKNKGKCYFNIINMI